MAVMLAAPLRFEFKSVLPDSTRRESLGVQDQMGRLLLQLILVNKSESFFFTVYLRRIETFGVGGELAYG